MCGLLAGWQGGRGDEGGRGDGIDDVGNGVKSYVIAGSCRWLHGAWPNSASAEFARVSRHVPNITHLDECNLNSGQIENLS